MSYYEKYDFDLSYNRSNWTPGVKGIFIACVVCFGVQALLAAFSPQRWYPWMEYYLALDPYNVVEHLYLWQLVTAAFMHSVRSPFHIIFNLMVLYFFGHLVERHYGTRKFLVFYFSCAIFASLVYTTFAFVQHVQSIGLGASGALLGLLVLCACLYPNILVIFLIFPMRCATMVMIIVGLDAYMALMLGAGAAMAHLGGAAFGYLFFKFSRFRKFWQLSRVRVVEQQDAAPPRKSRVPHAFALAQKRRERELAKLREEVDRLLDKINEQGMMALTPKEREFLKKASREYQKR